VVAGFSKPGADEQSAGRKSHRRSGLASRNDLLTIDGALHPQKPFLHS
jgi:hypothetical protein